jgi:hypothetical protein
VSRVGAAVEGKTWQFYATGLVSFAKMRVVVCAIVDGKGRFLLFSPFFLLICAFVDLVLEVDRYS